MTSGTSALVTERISMRFGGLVAVSQVSFTLARGAVHMARQQVIVKHLAAIEDFGSMDVLCSDKTGTLTTGTMVLDRCLDPVGHPDERPLRLAAVSRR